MPRKPKRPLNLSNFPVRRLFESLRRKYQTRFDERKVQIKTSLKRSCTLNADESLLEEGLKNLIDNALKYGDGMDLISLGCYEKPHSFVLFLFNNGPPLKQSTWKKFSNLFIGADSGLRIKLEGLV